MPLTAQDIPGDLMSSNEEFRKLAQEHSRYEQQLQQLTRQPYLSSEDILLEVQLKKMKLRLKDQMQQLIAHRRREQSHG
ncbi:MAG TPA: YdcH family protein [Candidatus Acidoferrales bacterium]|nr:YdcH family protein [Candidatus Acidoferrales bacterium]